jgi:hypothetical protein
MEEFKDILAGLEQRINVYKSKLQELQRKRHKTEDEIQTVKKYLELAETLYRVEIEKAKLTNPSLPLPTDTDRERPLRVVTPSLSEVNDRSKEILLERTKYVGLSVPQAAYLLLKEHQKPLHAKEIYQRLIEGGIRIRGKTPVTSVAISLSRDKRFKKIAPNTYDLAEAPQAAEEDTTSQGARAEQQGKGPAS